MDIMLNLNSMISHFIQSKTILNGEGLSTDRTVKTMNRIVE